MPIQTIQEDSSAVAPETTVDASGKEIVGNSIPKVDPRGLFITDADLKTAQEPVPTEEAVKEAETKVSTEAEARKLFLQAQKAERRAKEMEKKASDSLKRADAFEKAKALAASGEDPFELLKAAGLDPVKFYKDMTTFALKPEQTPEDPTAKQLREHKEQLEAYKKQNEDLANSIKDKEELQQHNKNIQDQVIPILSANPDNYECLLTQYGANAAVEVYKQVWELYQQKNEVISFEEAANQLEKYWSDQIESGLNAALKMKKFANRAQSMQTTSDKPEQKETPNRSFTLSNKQTVSASSKSNSQYDRYRSGDERAAEILRKLGH